MDEVARRQSRAYLGLMAVYIGALGGATIWAGRQGRLSRRVSPGDLLLYGVATHKLSRLIAKGVVTRPLREPFTGRSEHTGPAELTDQPVGTGWRRTMGELLTCPFCLAQWIATGAVFGHIAAPEVTRLVAGALTVHAVSDALQFGYAALERTEPR